MLIINRRRRRVVQTASITPPVISSISAGALSGGSLPITITATGYSDGDTVYWVIVGSGDTTPTVAEIVAGQASGGGSPDDSGSTTIASGSATASGVDIADGNYKLCVVLNNGANSNSSSATFTYTAPSAATPGLITEVATGTTNISGTSNSRTFSSVDLTGGVGSSDGDTIVVMVFNGASSGANQSTDTIDFGATTGVTPAVAADDVGQGVAVAMFTTTRGASDTVDIDVYSSSAGTTAMKPTKIVLFNAGTYDTVSDSAVTTPADTATQTLNVDTTADCLLFAMAMKRDGSDDAEEITFSGATEINEEASTNFNMAWAFDEVSSAETPRSVSSTTEDAFNHAACSLVLTET